MEDLYKEAIKATERALQLLVLIPKGLEKQKAKLKCYVIRFKCFTEQKRPGALHDFLITRIS